MSQINPFTGAILQAPHVQRTQAADRDRQLRRAQDLNKNAALAGEQLQHEVESSEAVPPAHNDQQQKGRKRNKRRGTPSDPPEAGGEAHIDVTA